MDMQLDYNIELFPLKAGQSFTMALASSLQRGGPTAGEDGEKDKDIWRPDGKGRGGLEEDYDYVMYGRVRLINIPLPTYPPCSSPWYAELTEHNIRCINLMEETRTLCMLRSSTTISLQLSRHSTVYASFGGLLMAMTGSYRHMSSIVLGESIYILLRK